MGITKILKNNNKTIGKKETLGSHRRLDYKKIVHRIIIITVQ